MAYTAYYVPALVLLICAVLYIFENKKKRKKWIYSVAVMILHVFVIIYFLFIELSMEIVLLFLLASLALGLKSLKEEYPDQISIGEVHVNEDKLNVFRP
jgi:presenilin-like A22 family membrane protease